MKIVGRKWLCPVFEKLLWHLHGEKLQNMLVEIIGFGFRPRTFHIQKENANLSAMDIVSLSGV
jgi:hypothetical protein